MGPALEQCASKWKGIMPGMPHLTRSTYRPLLKDFAGLLVVLLYSGWVVPAFSTPLSTNPPPPVPTLSAQEPNPLHFFKGVAHRQRLARGKLLIATPQIRGGTFSRTVILLLDYNPNGAMGLILNRPTEVPLIEVLPELENLRERPDVLHFGGPVAKNRVFLLHGSPSPLQENSARLIDGVYLGGNPEVLKHTLKQGESADQRFRVYAGYAGWAAGQLEGEVLNGDWQVYWGDAATVFEKSPIEMWRELLFISESRWTKLKDPRPESPLVASPPRLVLHSNENVEPFCRLPFPHAPARVFTLGLHRDLWLAPNPEVGESRSSVDPKFSCPTPHSRL